MNFLHRPFYFFSIMYSVLVRGPASENSFQPSFQQDPSSCMGKTARSLYTHAVDAIPLCLGCRLPPLGDTKCVRVKPSE